MARSPFQVLVFPYYVTNNAIEYAIFKRTETSGGFWQGIAGGAVFQLIRIEGLKQSPLFERVTAITQTL
jgi:dATP pyrophosphohydrolase